ncbi:hypothetical protein D3C72_2073650 [compost metagenome]
MSYAAKIVSEAQEDAILFVSSEGEIRTARLEHALAFLRSVNPKLMASDFEIAQAIISGE